MAHFAYKGRDAGGKLIEGVLEGASAGGVADLLLGRGVTPISIEETRSKAAGGMAFSLFKPRVEHVDILLFSRQLHTLLKAGVPIMRALNGLQELYGTVWLADGSWLTRREHDGCEWWEHRFPPPIPPELAGEVRA